MTTYITLDGVSSIDKGLRLVEAAPLILPARSRQREYLPGRIGSISASEFEYPAVAYKIRLALAGEGKADIVSQLSGLAGWMLSARRLAVWHDPDHYFTGAVEEAPAFTMLTRKTGQLEISFLCDPPCRQKAKVAGGWIPEAFLPIPEQITAAVNTASGAGSAAFTLSGGAVSGALPPAAYLRITGTWQTLVLGGALTVTEAMAAAADLYVDCDAQEVYRLASGVRTPVRYTGTFPDPAGGSLTVDGTGFDVTARLLIIERG